MSQRNIDFGSFPNDPSADAIRTAFQKVQENFTELFAGQEAQAVLSVNKTPGAGIEVFPKTGNVVVSAKIACVRIQSSTLGLGAGSGNTASSAIIVSGSTPIIIDIPETVTNVANIRLSNTITANFATINANISTGNLVASSNISATNILSGNITITANANLSQLNAANAMFTANVSAVNYTGTNVTLTGNLTASAGNVNAANASISGNITAGNANLGNAVTANYYIGDGGLLSNVVAAANSLIQLGTSNVKIPVANGNVNVSVNGNANVMVVTGTGANVSGTLDVSGNASLGNLTTNTATVTTGNITTINSGLIQNGTANITLAENGFITLNVANAARLTATSTGVSFSSGITVTGNANIGNVSTGGRVTATGNITGGNLITGGILAATGNVSGGNVSATGQMISTILGVAPLVVSSNVVVPNLYASRANVSDFGSLTLQTTGIHYLTLANGSATGNYALASNVTFKANVANGALIATTFVGNLSGAATSATTAGTVTTNAQPNITSVGNLTSLLVVGNTQSGNFIGPVANGTSNVNIPDASGNINFSVGNIANVTVMTSTGLNVSGTLNASGNANVGNLGTSGLITATGNISGGNLITTGLVAADSTVSGGNLTTSGTLNVTGNANVGNLGTSGLITATGNISGGNLTTTGALAVTGNANVGNLGTGGLITATGNVSGGNLTTSGRVAATGNVSGGNLTTTGALAVTGNANVGNLGTGGLITATGNVSGGNLTTSGQVTATGNINGGNLRTAGNITGSVLISNVAAGNAPLQVTSTTRVANLNVANAGYADSAGSATSATNASAVLNNAQVSGTYYPTFISGTANGNYSLASNAAFSANISNGFMGATLLGGTLTTASQPNVTSVGTLTSLGVTGNITSGNANLGNAVTANYYLGDGGLLSNITVSTGSYIVNGNSNVTVDLDGNVRTSVSGNANILVVTGTGTTVNGTLNANTVFANTFTGNIVTAAQPNITSLGNLTSLNMAGVANLGSNSNVKITGGVNNQFLITDGSGNLSWITPTGLTVAPGSNTQMLFNDAGSFAAAASFTYNKASGNANVGNIGAATGVFTNIAGTLTTAAQPNVTSVGTLTSLTVNGNIAAGNVTVSSGTVSGRYLSALSGSLTASTPAINATQTWNNSAVSFAAITATITDTASLAGSKLIDLKVGSTTQFSVDKVGVIVGNGSGLTSLTAANISGTVTSATNAAALLQNTSTATTVYPTFTTSSANGNSSAVINTGISANLANASITATTFVGSLSGTASAATNAAALLQNTSTATTVYPTFTTSSANGNSSAVINTAISANLANASISATTFVGSLSGAATTAGTVTTASQPNITSVGNLTSLTVTGNITTSANVNASDNLSIYGFQGANGDGEMGGMISLLSGNGGATGNTLGGTVSLTAGSGAFGGNINITPGFAVGTDKQGGTLTFRGGRGTGAGQPGNIVFQTPDATTTGTTLQTLANRIVISGNVVNVVTNVTSTSTSTGALRVVGGMGVGGNVYASAFYGAATGLTAIPGGNITGTISVPLANGTSNVSIPNADSNVNIIATGNATMVVTGTGANITGTANVTGNANVGNLGTTGLIVATGNVTGGNLITSALVSGNTLSVTGNANVGNLGTTQVLASANVIAPQLISNVATGTAPFIVTSTTKVANLNSDLLDGYTTDTLATANTIAVRDTTGNIAANYFVGNGSQLTGIITSVSNVTNGTSNINIPSANSNIALTVNGNANVMVVTANGVVMGTGSGGNITGINNVTSNSANVNGLLYTTSASQGYSSPSITAGVLTLNLTLSTVFGVTLNNNITTLNISNIQAAGKTSSFVLQLTADGTARTIVWPDSFKWPNGIAPTITSTNGKVDIIVAYTDDGGTNWFAMVSGQNF